jgi:hypothetical protein
VGRSPNIYHAEQVDYYEHESKAATEEVRQYHGARYGTVSVLTSYQLFWLFVRRRGSGKVHLDFVTQVCNGVRVATSVQGTRLPNHH